MLVVAYADDSLDYEEFLSLYNFYESVNPLYPYWNFDPLCLDSFECLLVRVKKLAILRYMHKLRKFLHLKLKLSFKIA